MFEDPSFWVAISFILFVLAAIKPARKFILGGLDKRADKIRAELDEAARLREEAQAALAAYQRQQREATDETRDIIANAEEEAERLRARSLEEMEAMLTRRQQQALDRIAQAEAEALQEVRAKAVNIAVAASRELMADALEAKRGEALITDAIADLPKKLN